MKKITVYCGESIQDKCGKQRHPSMDVLHAQKLVLSENDEIVCSNSPDFVRAVKYIGEKFNVETEFFLNGNSCGNDIEPIFENFNIAFEMLKDACNIDSVKTIIQEKQDVRAKAMEWWNTLSSDGKTRICDIHTELVGSVRRWETLTGSEIQKLYESEHNV